MFACSFLLIANTLHGEVTFINCSRLKHPSCRNHQHSVFINPPHQSERHNFYIQQKVFIKVIIIYYTLRYRSLHQEVPLGVYYELFERGLHIYMHERTRFSARIAYIIIIFRVLDKQAIYIHSLYIYHYKKFFILPMIVKMTKSKTGYF